MTDFIDNRRDERQEAERIGILVLGMHRSGTSALAGFLHLLGCDLPAHLLRASLGNELGHWESEPIMALNDQILASAGSAWDDWSPVNSDWYKSPFHASFLEIARETLRSEFGSSPLFVLKDPRVCKLAPLWLEVLDLEKISPRIVIPVRNPLEVSASLMNRDAIDNTHGRLLWLRHILDAEYSSRGRHRIFCTYDQLLQNHLTLIKRLQTKLDLTWPQFTAINQAHIAEFLSSKNRHHSIAEETVFADPALPRWLRDGYATLLRWSEGDEESDDYVVLDSVRREFDAASHAFAPLLTPGHRSLTAGGGPERMSLQNELDAAHSRVEAAEAAVRDIQAKVEEAQCREAQLNAHLEHSTSEIARLLPELEASRIVNSEALGQLAASQAASREVIDQLNGEIERLNAALNTSHDETAKLAHRLATAESTLQQRVEEIEQTRQALEVANQAIQCQRTDAERLQKRLEEADAWVFRLAGDRRAAEVGAEVANRNLAAAQQSLLAVEQVRDGLQIRLERMESERKHETREAPLPDLSARTAEQEAEIQKLSADFAAQKTVNEQLLQELTATQDTAKSAAAELDDRFREIATMTKLLHTSEVQRQLNSSQIEWLRQVNSALMTSPRRWLLLPRSWARKRQFQRLKAKDLFDAERYLELHPDVVADGMDPLRHYILHGLAEGRER